MPLLQSTPWPAVSTAHTATAAGMQGERAESRLITPRHEINVHVHYVRSLRRRCRYGRALDEELRTRLDIQ